MHPLENITVSTTSEAGLSHAVPRYSGEPDPFKHATDVSQCVTCGAQITVRLGSAEIFSRKNDTF